MPALWTIGIEGRSAEDVVRVLKEYRVERVVDVRSLPITDRPGFSQAPLSRLLADAGIAYDLRRELGPSAAAQQKLAADGDWEAYRAAYDTAVPRLAIAALAHAATGQRVALLADARDPHRCHRSLLARRMEPLGFRVSHLL